MTENIVTFYYGKDKIQGLLSKEDEDLAKFYWVQASGYARGQSRQNGYRGKYVHRIVLERTINRPLEKDEWCDHINGIITDNRRSNLRPQNKFLNQGNRKMYKNNTTGYRGVCITKTCRFKPYAANIRFGKSISLGYFSNPIDAAKAYDQAAIKYHGEFARTNFPREDYADNIF